MDGGVAGAGSGVGLGSGHRGGHGGETGGTRGERGRVQFSRGERVPGSSVDLRWGKGLGGQGKEKERERGARLTHTYTD